MLARYEARNPVQYEVERAKVDVSTYSEPEPVAKPVQATITPSMPRPTLPPVITKYAATSEIDTEPDMSDATGVVEATESVYNAIVAQLSAPNDDPHKLGDWARLEGRSIVITRKLLLVEYPQIETLWDNEGEILFSEPLATWQHVKSLQKTGLKIVTFSKTLIEGYADGIELRWTPENGAEIVVNLKKKSVFDAVFRATDVNHAGQHWLRYPSYHRPEEAQSTICGINTNFAPQWGWCYHAHFGSSNTATKTAIYRRPTRWKSSDETIVTPYATFSINIKKIGQQTASEGNNVKVELRLTRTVSEQQVKLLPNIEIWGNKFCNGWGTSVEGTNTDYNNPNGTRRATKTITASTYQKAIQQARIEAHQAIVDTYLAYRKRRQALELAEKSLIEA